MRDVHTSIFLQAALNGDRIPPAAPRTPTAIAEAARAAVDAGAQSVQLSFATRELQINAPLPIKPEGVYDGFGNSANVVRVEKLGRLSDE
jgi:hypothetical protein